MKLPTNFQEAAAVKATLELYKVTCSKHIIALMICLYLFLQVRYAKHSVPLLLCWYFSFVQLIIAIFRLT